jgi:pimeloyl-ACP methyl ester carboxylesterase
MRSLMAFVAVFVFGVATAARAGEDKFFSSDGVKIRYTDQGTGEPVILIHGFSVNREYEWVKPGILPALVKDYRVIAIDVRGHGKSDKPHDPKKYGAQMGQDVLRLMDSLEIPRAHVIGYSMGAMITAKLLADHPGRFLTATVGGGAGQRAGAPQGASGLSDRSAMLAALDRGEMTPDMAARNNDPTALAAAWRSLPELAWDEEKMKHVNVPVLAAVGSEDQGLAGAKELQRVLRSTNAGRHRRRDSRRQ